MGRLPAFGGGLPNPNLGEGMLITGGYNDRTYLKSVEAYNPHISKICKLPDMPDSRYGHTVCGGLLCGGQESYRSCLKLGPLGFVKATVTLQQNRFYHHCWNVPEGVLLLGGEDSPSTTELVQRDGSTSVSKFDLSYPAE